MGEKVRKRISVAGVDPLLLYGRRDAHLAAIERRFSVKVVARGEEVMVEGDPGRVEQAAGLLEKLKGLLENGVMLDEMDLQVALEYLSEEKGGLLVPEVILSTRRGPIRPRSVGQYLYVQAIRSYDVVFGIGPAGTGKTYLAVAMAVAALRERKVSKIVLSRPAVEAGESLGFLPGDFLEKVDPYLRPLYDALEDMLPPEKLKALLENRTIEVIPLAYMRGRTLNNAFAILDEAQNTLPVQMKMFLTRLGVGSKAVVTGDVTQIDLPDPKSSGLVQIQKILADVEGVKFVYLSEQDVVRHRLVREIIKAYDRFKDGGTE
ncbi:MAG: hypothetical protein DRP95_01535 [Candidatus Latescibacterota bacterium]|nr:MAG: hypothetical protein DRP95_01535 [Candidatus Latescibacterota bacterium]